jgi:hypothetical protein
LKNRKWPVNIGWNPLFFAKNPILKKACQTYRRLQIQIFFCHNACMKNTKLIYGQSIEVNNPAGNGRDSALRCPSGMANADLSGRDSALRCPSGMANADLSGRDRALRCPAALIIADAAGLSRLPMRPYLRLIALGALMLAGGCTLRES